MQHENPIHRLGSHPAFAARCLNGRSRNSGPSLRHDWTGKMRDEVNFRCACANGRLYFERRLEAVGRGQNRMSKMNRKGSRVLGFDDPTTGDFPRFSSLASSVVILINQPAIEQNQVAPAFVPIEQCKAALRGY